MLCASHELAASCGQAPIGEFGDVLYSGNMAKQTRQVIATMDRILADAQLSSDHLERIVVFTSVQEAAAVRKSLEEFRNNAPKEVNIFAVPLPPLFYDDLLLEVDYYALPQMRDKPNLVTFSISIDINPTLTRLPKEFSENLLHQSNDSLIQRGLSWDSIVKLSFFSPCKNNQFWNSLSDWRRNFPVQNLPAISDMISESSDQNTLTIDFTCAPNPAWGKPIFVGDQLPGGYPEAIKTGPLLFTSSLFSHLDCADSKVSVKDEVDSIMLRHQKLLSSQGFDFSDVIKSTTFYQGSGSADALHENMSARNNYYQTPGPGSTGLPVSAFPHLHKRTSIELIASL